MSDGTPPGYDREEEKMAGNAGNNVTTANDNDIYQSLDPLDPRKVSLEIFELYCHEMITAPIVGRRAYLITKMRYMVKRLIGHQYNYGRLYNRTCIANIVARVCARHPYPIDDNSDDEEDDGYNYRLSDCIVDWDSDKWQKIITQFESLRDGLLRNDAAKLVLPAEFGDEDKEEEEEDDEAPAQDDSVNPMLESSKEFGENYTSLVDLMKFHMCLSHIRSPQFEDMMKKGSDGGEKAGSPVFISHDDTVALNNEIEKMFGNDSDNKYAVILNSLLESRSKKRSRSGRSGGLHLKSFDEIKKIHDNNADVFDLGIFQTDFLKQIRRWSEMVLPIPELAKFGYGSIAPPPIPDNKENISSLGSAFATKTTTAHQHPQNDPAESVEFDENVDDGDDESEEETEKKVDRLRRTRDKFMQNVKDPLPSIVEKAKSARSRTAQARQAAAGSESTVSTPSFRKKKKSEHKITFTDSEDEEEDDGDDKDDVDYNEEDEVEEKGVTLSEVPKKFKQKVAASPKKIVVSTKTKSKGKRVKFTDSEDAAIRNGVDKFGVGRWADIKAFYHIDLADRSSVQIKDRWRTLNK